MSALSVFLLVSCSCFLFFCKKNLFFLPFIAVACFVPMNQRIILLGLDFTLLRILIIVGITRIILRGESRNISLNGFDKLILGWLLIGSIIYSLQQANVSAVINRAGFFLDSFGIYWLFRQMVSNWQDVSHVIRFFGIFAIITAPLIAIESVLRINLFSYLGPVIGDFHRGRFRAAGPFPHYIMLGCFWATLLPFFYAEIKANTHKGAFFYWLAIAAALSNVYFSASSTPLMTVIGILLFWKLYSYRTHGQLIFVCSCLVLFLLHLVMKAPVWHLMARANVFGGSTGWHRFFLFDNFINNFSEWVLIGTQSTTHWGRGLQDITNQFVLEGVRGGLITLIVFIIIVYRAVKIPGKYSLATTDPKIKWLSWGLCVASFSHFVTFWGVSYFGQINLVLFFVFALVGYSLETMPSTTGINSGSSGKA